jgi:hypothetical protein
LADNDLVRLQQQQQQQQQRFRGVECFRNGSSSSKTADKKTALPCRRLLPYIFSAYKPAQVEPTVIADD